MKRSDGTVRPVLSTAGTLHALGEVASSIAKGSVVRIFTERVLDRDPGSKQYYGCVGLIQIEDEEGGAEFRFTLEEAALMSMLVGQMYRKLAGDG